MPSDGKILNYGEVRDSGDIEQVKGVTYSLKGFFGPQNQNIYEQMNNNNNSIKPLSDLEFQAMIKRSDDELLNMPDQQYYRLSHEVFQEFVLDQVWSILPAFDLPNFN